MNLLLSEAAKFPFLLVSITCVAGELKLDKIRFPQNCEISLTAEIVNVDDDPAAGDVRSGEGSVTLTSTGPSAEMYGDCLGVFDYLQQHKDSPAYRQRHSGDNSGTVTWCPTSPRAALRDGFNKSSWRYGVTGRFCTEEWHDGDIIVTGHGH